MNKSSGFGQKNLTFIILGKFLIILLSLHSLYANEEPIVPLFDEKNRPQALLLNLLEIVGMQPLSQSPYEINQWTQMHLLRSGERWEQTSGRFENLKPQIKPILSRLGYVEEVSPRFQTYQGAIVHGALLSGLQYRLDYLLQLWKQGIRFPSLYFLSGERPLEQYEKKSLCLIDPQMNLQTEYEMTKFLWEHTNVPNDMRNKVAIYYINAPMQKDIKLEKMIRPNTDDSVRAWLSLNPPHGRYLAVTNNPYVQRQDLVIKTIAPATYSFDTVGPKANQNERMAIFLDELARYIYVYTKQQPHF